MKRKKPLRRSRIRRRRPSVEGLVEHEAWRLATFERSNCHCERCGPWRIVCACLGCEHPRNCRCFCPECAREWLDPHHLWPKGRAGRAIDELWNSASLCRLCHTAVTDHQCEDWPDWLASNEEGAREIRERLDARLISARSAAGPSSGSPSGP